jgi:hypothetical protein
MDTTTAIASDSSLGKWSIRLFAAGLLVPPLIALIVAVPNAFAPNPISSAFAATIAVFWAVACELLAFIFGIVGRQTRHGKIGMYGSGTLILVTVLPSILWFFSSSGLQPVRPRIPQPAVPQVDRP